MTLQELYINIDGSYEQATRVLRMDKLINKHILKFPNGGVADALLGAADTMDPTAMFEAAHAMKGVCSNLGLTALADGATEISEEFRPGNARTMSDEAVRERIEEIRAQYQKTVAGIKEYEADNK